MVEPNQLSELPTGPGEPLAPAELGLVAASLGLGIFLLLVLALTLPPAASLFNGPVPVNTKPAAQ